MDVQLLASLMRIHQDGKYRVNTSSTAKLDEFKKYLNGKIIPKSEDLPEPDADPLTVVVYKASQFDKVLVDDTSLDITGETVGVNVKWLINTLHNHIGKTALYRCLIAIASENQVFVFQGIVKGIISEESGLREGLGFLPYFKPQGSNQTLAEYLPDAFNARYFAIQSFLHCSPYRICPLLKNWNGKYQVPNL